MPWSQVPWFLVNFDRVFSGVQGFLVFLSGLLIVVVSVVAWSCLFFFGGCLMVFLWL